MMWLSLFVCASCQWLTQSSNHGINESGKYTKNLNMGDHVQGLMTPIGSGRNLLDVGFQSTDDCYFFEGVASGDPSDTDVVLWTRIYCEDYGMLSNDSIPVYWEISLFKDFSIISNDGITQTNIDIDYTVKIIADRLEPDTWYFYRFYIVSSTDVYYYSDIGRTRTFLISPTPDDDYDRSRGQRRGRNTGKQVRFGFGSCSQWAHGYFNNFGDLADMAEASNHNCHGCSGSSSSSSSLSEEEKKQGDNAEGIDFMLWLGDYIYEYGDNDYVSGVPLGRVADPPDHNLYTLDDYRSRYKQSLRDFHLYRLRQLIPWIIMWDDHEFVDDYWKYGSDNHDDDNEFNVTFNQRKYNAYRAFYEYIPMRLDNLRSNLHNSHNSHNSHSGSNGRYDHFGFDNNDNNNNIMYYGFNDSNFTGISKKYRIGGDLIDLFLIDARSQSTRQLDTIEDGFNLSIENHTLLGPIQREWLLNGIKKSKAQWIILATCNVFGRSPTVPDIFLDDIFGSGKYEGYNMERQLIIDTIIDNNIDNILFISGGPHTPVLQKIYSEFDATSDTAYSIGVEIVSDAIGSPKFFEKTKFSPAIESGVYQEEWGHIAPYIKTETDGFQVVTVNDVYAKIEFYLNDNIWNQLTHASLDGTFCVFKNVSWEIYDQQECQSILTDM